MGEQRSIEVVLRKYQLKLLDKTEVCSWELSITDVSMTGGI